MLALDRRIAGAVKVTEWSLILIGPSVEECFKSGFNKNLAIANISRVSCAHSTLRAFIGLNIKP